MCRRTCMDCQVSNQETHMIFWAQLDIHFAMIFLTLSEYFLHAMKTPTCTATYYLCIMNSQILTMTCKMCDFLTNLTRQSLLLQAVHFFSFFQKVECPIKGQKYFECAPCPATCEEPNPICPKICKPGCACPEGKVLKNGKECVKPEKCPKGLHMTYV